ncbi:NAD(P)/FAD-dependent oxidoreductase [Tenacibaculum sp. 190524A05c]|uniref:NAD(P)/FAD-dependent oxidoreductase n=1 Tax=Tenacibaculum platacis TaxID=3137852 RepID=UPI0031FABB26
MNYDVVIIGAGTAGLMLSRELGKQKINTLVLDRKKDLLNFTFNTLGSFINLEEFDLTENVVAQEINSAILYSKNFKRKLTGSAYVLDKKKLHEEMLASLDMNYVTIQKEVAITSVEQDEHNNITSVIDKKGNSYKGKIIVDASGTAGVISKKVGLQEKKVKLATGVEYNVKYLGDPKEVHLLVGKEYKGGYGWVFPLQNQRAIFGFGTFDEEVVKDLKKRLNDILESPTIKKMVVKDNELVEGGSIPLTPVLDKFVLNNLVCVGDSVSQVNPIAGEGYKFIFESAIMASKAIVNAIHQDDLTPLSQYETDWKKRFLKSYKRAKFSQEKIFKYSKKDYLMDFAMLLLKLRSNKSIIKSLSGEFA